MNSHSNVTLQLYHTLQMHKIINNCIAITACMPAARKTNQANMQHCVKTNCIQISKASLWRYHNVYSRIKSLTHLLQQGDSFTRKQSTWSQLGC